MKILQTVARTLVVLSLVWMVSSAVGEPLRPIAKRQLVKEDIPWMRGPTALAQAGIAATRRAALRVTA